MKIEIIKYEWINKKGNIIRLTFNVKKWWKKEPYTIVKDIICTDDKFSKILAYEYMDDHINSELRYSGPSYCQLQSFVKMGVDVYEPNRMRSEEERDRQLN